MVSYGEYFIESGSDGWRLRVYAPDGVATIAYQEWDETNQSWVQKTELSTGLYEKENVKLLTDALLALDVGMG